MDFILRENSGLAASCKKHPNRVICRRIMNYCRSWDLSLDLTHLTYTTPYYTTYQDDDCI